MVDEIVISLSKVDPDNCKLSTLNYEDLKFPREIYHSKYLERPFAYEFYHQFRKLIDNKEIKLEESILIQGEVDKRYQNIEKLSKIPDFLVHSPSTEKNIAVIEFKMASRDIEDIKNDFKKLLSFRDILGYEELIEIIIGNTGCIESKDEELKILINEENFNIWLVLFDITKRKISKLKIKYNS